MMCCFVVASWWWKWVGRFSLSTLSSDGDEGQYENEMMDLDDESDYGGDEEEDSYDDE